ncbi:MAG: GyrI-like domain-containing protein [Ginsengibacter sp.]
MKVLLFVFFIALVLALLIPFVFIPRTITFSKIAYIKTNSNVAARFITNRSAWQSWWPHPKKIYRNNAHNSDAGIFHFRNASFSPNSSGFDRVGVAITTTYAVLNSTLKVLPLNKDSIAIEWEAAMPEAFNPVNRIRYYFFARHLKHEMADILTSLKDFSQNTENVYGIAIREAKVKDTLLVSTKFTSIKYPSTASIYTAINQLKEYIKLNGAEETNYPMLHIKANGFGFETMSAIPVNKAVPPGKNFLIKRMIPGKILVAEVKGGSYSTANALKQLDTFLDDNQFRSPAIPFESLVTDRSVEKDTSRWLTKIYYPIY